jgi:acyl carrier protein
MNTTFQRVQKILVNRLGLAPQEVLTTSHIKKDLGADSLDAIEIIMDVESEFLIQLEDDTSDDITTVSSLIEHIEQRIAK